MEGSQRPNRVDPKNLHHEEQRYRIFISLETNEERDRKKIEKYKHRDTLQSSL